MSAKAEKRAHNRKPTRKSSYLAVSFIVENDIATSNEVKAFVTDISDSGVGLLTERSLAPGQKIKFTNKKRLKDLPETGVVMWTTVSKEGHKAGVMFS